MDPAVISVGMDVKERVRVGPADVAYVVRGAGDPVLFLHGFPTHGFLWRHVLGALHHDVRGYAPDLLGAGDTEISPYGDFSLAAQAQTMFEFLDAMDLAEVAIVGHDVGGGVAQIMAGLHPERIRALVLVDTVFGDSWPVPALRRVQKVLGVPGVRGALRPAARPALRAAFARGTWGPAGFDREAVEEYARPLRTPTGWARFERWTRSLDVRFLRDLDLATVKIPTLVVWGADDPFLPVAAGRATASRLPDAELRILAWCGHWVPEERPRELANAIGGFLCGRTGSGVEASGAGDLAQP